MPSVLPFDPLQVGAVDNFAFDFADQLASGEQMVSTSWDVSFGNAAGEPYPPPGTYDGDPQSRVMSVSTATTFPVRQPNGLITNQIGAFSIALFGLAPASSAGGAYLVTATLNLSYGRVLIQSGTIASFSPAVAPILTIPAVFDYNLWVSMFPEFCDVPPATAQGYFNLAEMYWDNTGSCNCMETDPASQLLYLNLLTAHLAQLFGTTNGQPNNPGVGRITSATQGSVTLQWQFDIPANASAQWYNQTKYGAAFWAATAACRTMRYRAGPRRNFDGIYGGRYLVPPWL